MPYLVALMLINNNIGMWQISVVEAATVSDCLFPSHLLLAAWLQDKHNS